MNGEVEINLAVVGAALLVAALGRHWWDNLRPARLVLQPLHADTKPPAVVHKMTQQRKQQLRHQAHQRLARSLYQRNIFGSMRRSRTEAKKMLQGQL